MCLKIMFMLGFQGALVSQFLEKPLYFSSIVLGKCSYDRTAMRRAVFERARAISSLSEGFAVKELQILQGDVEFEHSKRAVEEGSEEGKKVEKTLRASPSGNSMVR